MGTLHKIIFLLFALLATTYNSPAAFPLRSPVTAANQANLLGSNETRYKMSFAKTHRTNLFSANHHKKKWIAFILCLFLGWCAAHRFYLGYYHRDDILELAPSILGAFCVSAGILVGLVALFPGSKNVIFSILAYILIAIIAGLLLWELIDLIRIITGSLNPADGEYQ